MLYFGGPTAVSSQGQVAIPAEARRLVGIATRERVYVAVFEDRPRVVALVPEDVGRAWASSGAAVAGSQGGRDPSPTADLPG